MHVLPILRALALLTLANGTPVVAKRVLRGFWSLPLDANRAFFDGRPLFGPSKTIRGLLASILVTSGSAPIFGLAPQTGAVVAAVAMAGDLLSSFVKRRLGIPASGRAVGLDQLPESLLPLLAAADALALSAVDIAASVALFFFGELLLSRLLFRMGVRDRPY